jgi:hypothetical protein
MPSIFRVLFVLVSAIWFSAGGALGQSPFPLPFPSNKYLGVTATNNNRTTIGYSLSISTYVTTALVWKQGQFEELGVSGFTSSVAYSLNNSDMIVGSVFKSPDDGPRPVIWNGETGTLLPTMGDRGMALDINDAGVIVGSVDVPYVGTQAAVWTDGKLSILQSPGALSAEATAIDDDGVIYGLAYVLESSGSVPVRWDNGVMSTLPINFGPDYLGVVGIRDARAGVVTGYVIQRETLPDGTNYIVQLAIAWENGQFRMLERPSGVGNSRAFNVSRDGQSVGSVENEIGETIPVVWTKEGPNILPSAPGSSMIAVAGNDFGYIVGIDYTNRSAPYPVAWDMGQEVSIAMPDMTVAVGQTVLLRATATKQGKPQGGQQITFLVNGQVAGKATTSSSGGAVLGYSIPKGTKGSLAVSASRAGSAVAMRSLIVGKSSTIAAVTPPIGRTGQRVNLTANLRLGVQNTPLAKKVVSFIHNGAVVARATTDASGIARTSIVMGPSATGGNTQIEVRYGGDASTTGSVGRVSGYLLK